MEGKAIRKKRKVYTAGKLIGLCAIALLVIFWGRCVYAVNQQIPQVKTVVMKGSQWNEWKDGIQLKIDGMDFMEDADIREAVVSEEFLYDYEMKVLWMNIQIKNESTAESQVDLLNIGAETEGWSNIPDMQLYEALGDSQKSLKFNLKPGENVSYRLPFLFLKSNFRDANWKKIEDEKYYITLALYPEKKMIQVN